MSLLTLNLLFVPAPASAQDVSDGEMPALNAQTFRPSIDSRHFFRIIDADLPLRQISGGGMLSWTSAPLQYTTADGVTTDLVGEVLQLDVVGAYRIGRARIGLDLPIYLRSFGGATTAATGVGDLAVDGKVRLLDPTEAPVGLAASIRAYAPIATVQGLDAGGAGLDLGVGVSRQEGRATLALDVGTILQPSVALENTTWGSQLFVDVGTAVAINDRAGASAEIHAASTFQSFADTASSPLELLLGGWIQAGPLTLRPGVGFGLNRAIGSPDARAVLWAAYDPAPPPADPDPDRDGLLGAADACPTVPEDADGYEDTDGCAEPTAVTVHIVDTDGMPVPDGAWTEAGGASGGDGARLSLDPGPRTFTAGGLAVTTEIPPGPPTEVTLAVPAPRGYLEVTIKDQKGAAIPGATWAAAGPTSASGPAGGRVPVRPGTYELTGGAPGYRPAKASVTVARDGSATLVLELAPAKAEVRAERIDIRESVFFETNRAIIKPESFGLLDEIAELLIAHPELTKIRIEGHTDSRGSAADNLRLSEQRAAAVRDYLIGKGVAADRLESAGYGEGRPLVKGENEAAWSKNRRVDFFVVARADGGDNGDLRRIEVAPAPVP